MSNHARARLLFGAAAFLSLLLSVYLWFRVDQMQGIFVGLWVPSILSLGAFLQSSARNRS